MKCLTTVTIACLLLLICVYFKTESFSKDSFEAIQDDFKSELKINEKYFDEMLKASSLEQKYEIFFKYRLEYLKSDLLLEIEEMKEPMFGTPANVFPSIISYIDDEEKDKWSPFSERYFHEYKEQISQYVR